MLQNSSNKKKIVIAGAGFAGLRLARKLRKTEFDITLLDKHNFHQFQPLFYQIATSGLEPSSISFPLRKIFQHSKNVHIRLCEITEIQSENNILKTSVGDFGYDILVLALGADTNFFGMKNIKEKALGMKTTPEAMRIRNLILKNFEDALVTTDESTRLAMMNIAIVGGGPTGVELAGALSEMRKFVLPEDFPELDFSKMNIYLLEAGSKLLGAMSEKSQNKVLNYLQNLGVEVMLNAQVKDFDGTNIYLNDKQIHAKTLIWAAGVSANTVSGLSQEILTRGNRLKTNRFNLVEGYENIYALGDMAYMTEPDFPNGHPQVAQTAIQQADNLAKNFNNFLKNKPLKEFSYKDLGAMATVGRNLAVVDLKKMKFSGTIAWFFWLFVHLMAIVGVKNRVFIFVNWVVSYFTYDQSLRLILQTSNPNTGNR